MTTNKTVYELSTIIEIMMEKRRPPGNQVGYRIMFILVSAIGICSNSVICFVFLTRQSIRSARNIYIANLSLGNLLLSLTLVPFIFEPQMKPFWPHNQAACKFFNSFSGMNVYCSTFSTIAIAADRYSTLRRRTPTNSAQLLSSSLYCLLIWIISALFVTPLMVYCDTAPVNLNLTVLRENFVILGTNGSESATLGHICEYKPPENILLLLTFTQVLFLLPIPLTCLVILNYLVHSFLRKRQQKQRSLLAHSAGAIEKQHKLAMEHRRVSILLFAMVGSLAVVWSPFHVVTMLTDLKVFEGSTEEFRKWDLAFQLLSHTSLFINPILYGFYNYNYNREIKRLFLYFCPCCPFEITSTRRKIIISAKKRSNNRKQDNLIDGGSVLANKTTKNSLTETNHVLEEVEAQQNDPTASPPDAICVDYTQTTLI